MAKFAVVLKQQGEGCDYSIGCGMTLLMLDASTRDEALIEAKRRILGKPSEDAYYGYEDSYLVGTEANLESATVVQIEYEFPVKEWYHQILAAQAASDEKQKLAKERAEYERLQKKFGKA